MTIKRFVGGWPTTSLALAMLAVAPHGYAQSAPSSETDVADGSAVEDPAEGETQSVAERIARVTDYDTSRDPKQAIVELTELIEAAEEMPDIDPVQLAMARATLGGAYFYTREYETALAMMKDAEQVMIAQGAADTPDMGELVSNIGAILSSMQRMGEALAYQERSLAMREKLMGADSGGYASSLYGIGLTYYRLGKIDEALPRIERAVRIKQAADAQSGKIEPNTAIYWMSYAALLDQIGRQEEALTELRGVSRWADENLGAEHVVTAAVMSNLGATLNNAGRYGEAEQVLRRALDMRVKLMGETDSDVAESMNNLAFALAMLGHPDEAEQLYLNAKSIYEANYNSAAPDRPGTMLLNAANSALNRGAEELAMQRRTEAVDLLEAAVPAESTDLARARLDLADSYQQAGRDGEALALVEQALGSFEASLDPSHHFRVQAGILHGALLYGAGEEEAGLAVANAAANEARNTLLDRLTSQKDFVRSAPRYAPLFINHARLQLAAGDMAGGFESIQLARINDVDLASAALASRFSAENKGAAEMLRELQDSVADGIRLRKDLTEATAAKDRDTVTATEGQIAANDAEVDRLSSELATNFPEYRALSRPEPRGLASLQSSLAADEALLLAVPTTRGLLSMLIDSSGADWQFSRSNGGELGALAAAVRAGAAPTLSAGGELPEFDFAASSKLYRAIVPETFDARLANKARLNIVSAGYLSSLPFALLLTEPATGGLDGASWLIRRFALAEPASLSTFGSSVRAERQGELRFAGFGDPAIGGSQSPIEVAALFRGGAVNVDDVAKLPRLRNAAREIEGMARAIGRRQDNLAITGAEATETRVKSSNLAQYQILGFATHGLVGGEMRGLAEPALVLTPPKEASATDNGLLTASEIADLRLDADLVVLSACNTASAGAQSEPTYSGLARAFIYAGARSLMLSHWQVRDDVAARLTVDTISGSASGTGRAGALRQAVLSLMNDPDVADAAHPAIWAPFVLIEG